MAFKEQEVKELQMALPKSSPTRSEQQLNSSTKTSVNKRSRIEYDGDNSPSSTVKKMKTTSPPNQSPSRDLEKENESLRKNVVQLKQRLKGVKLAVEVNKSSFRNVFFQK